MEWPGIEHVRPLDHESDTVTTQYHAACVYEANSVMLKQEGGD